MYQPLVFKLDPGETDILDKPNDNIILSSTINNPLISLGFHYYIYRTRKNMSIVKNADINKKTFYAPNPFEYEISNYEDSIKNLTKIYLGIKQDTHKLLSREFYKIWEILFLFDIVNNKELTIGAITNDSEIRSSNTDIILQTIINYRDKLGTSTTKKDKMFSIIFGKGTNDKNNNITTINIKDINKTKVNLDLLIANCELTWEDENSQEQEYQLILDQIITALKTQTKNGNFILKVFDTFTIPTIKLIYILSGFYLNIYIYKPFLSRPSNPEKYIICKDFKYDQKKDSTLLDKKIKTLEEVSEKMNSKKFVFDIFPKLILTREYLDKFTFINTKLVNLQQIMINEYKKFYDEDNYYGDKFHKFRDKQIEATKWWINNFYPPSNNLFIKNKEEIQQLLNTTMNKYQAEQTKFVSTLLK